MAVCTLAWLVPSILFIYATLVGGRYFEVEKNERQVPVIGGRDPLCYDNVTNCQDYIDHDVTICSSDSPFYGWTTTHCRASCNVCQGGPVTLPPICVDELNYCATFDIPKACTDFPKWASEKCRRTCQVCHGGPTTTPPLCVDSITTCGTFQIPEDCLRYPDWAQETCRHTCKVCHVLEPPTVRPVPAGVGRR